MYETDNFSLYEEKVRFHEPRVHELLVLLLDIIRRKAQRAKRNKKFIQPKSKLRSLIN